MKKFLSCVLLLCAPVLSWSAPLYDNYFTGDVLRFDYLMSGNHSTTTVVALVTKKEKQWGGSPNNLIDKQNLGSFCFKIFDEKSGELIFSKGFCSLFQEWQTTAEAKKVDKAFYQVLRFPFPKMKVLLKIEKRDFDGKFREIYATEIDPENYFIIDERPININVERILYSGEPSHKIDIAILAEGYIEEEMDKFVADARILTDSLFAAAPFSEMKGYFNVYAVKTASAESGTDIPGDHKYCNTLYNSTFYTFDISRYLTTSDMKTICDMGAVVPYDQLYVLVNSTRYGGGGFYNFVTVCTNGHKLSPKVFVHEFVHGFGGLADEYYTSEVAYQNYYNLKVEPWEPNITTLVDFSSKWKGMLSSDTPVPTPRTEEYISTIGAYEGGGYIPKGMFSPMQNCRMKSNETDAFCRVCQSAIRMAIIENTK